MSIISLLIQDVNPVDTSPIINKFLEFGIVGVILIIAIYWIYHQNKQHKSEVETWKTQLEKERLEWVEERKEWNGRLETVVSNHMTDLEKHGNDRAQMIEKYHQFMDTINKFIETNKN